MAQIGPYALRLYRLMFAFGSLSDSMPLLRGIGSVPIPFSSGMLVEEQLHGWPPIG